MNLFLKQLRAGIILFLIVPTISLASSADHCPDEFEIVDFGIYESGVFGEGPRTFGGILLKVGKRAERRTLEGYSVACVPEKYTGSKKQYFEGYEVPLVTQARIRRSNLSFVGSGERANEFMEVKWKVAFDSWVKRNDSATLKGSNFTCLYHPENKDQDASDGYGCIATIEGMPYPDTQFSCGFGCRAYFSFENGFIYQVDISSAPEFLKNAKTISEAEAAWEVFILEIRADVLSRIIERNDRFKVVNG
jgi:hypothetical protein